MTPSFLGIGMHRASMLFLLCFNVTTVALRRTSRALAIAVLALHVVTLSMAADFRVWTDSTGRFKREAKAESSDGNSVTLLLRSGESVTVRIDRLSKSDQEHVTRVFGSNRPQRVTLRQLLASAGIPKDVSNLSTEEKNACDSIGKGIESAVRAGEEEQRRWVDSRHMAEKSIEGLGVPESALEAVISKNATDIKEVLNTRLLGAACQPKYLRAIKRDEAIHLVYRVLDAGGSPGYFSLVLGPRLEGQMPVKDVYVYAAGETVTQTVRRGNMLIAAAADPALGGKLKGEDAELIHNRESLERVQALISENKKKEAINCLKELPQNRFFAYYRLALAAEIGGQDFHQACDDYRKAFPGDMTTSFVSLSQTLMRGDEQDVLMTADQIEGQIGPDPYLDFVRGNLADADGNGEKAVSLWLRAIAAEPDLLVAYERLRLKYLELKDYEHVAELIELLEKEFSSDLWDAIGRDERSQEFLLSEPGQRWRKSKNLAPAK